MIVLFALHVVEQWFTDFDKAFEVVSDKLKPIQKKFGKNKGIFIVIAFVFFIWLIMTYLLLLGNAFPALLFWTLLLISEVHHVIEAIKKKGYYPGTITGFLLFLLGLVFASRLL